MWLPVEEATLAGPGTEGPRLRACPALSLEAPPPHVNGLSSTCMHAQAISRPPLSGIIMIMATDTVD